MRRDEIINALEELILRVVKGEGKPEEVQIFPAVLNVWAVLSSSTLGYVPD